MSVAVSLRQEATELLQALIRLDTVNPPGNETQAAELLRSYLEENGVACELYAREPERANLVARIPGSAGGPRLALLSHTDTVLADAAEWQVDPWSGELRDGAELLAEAEGAFLHVPLEHFLATMEGRAAADAWRRRLERP